METIPPRSPLAGRTPPDSWGIGRLFLLTVAAFSVGYGVRARKPEPTVHVRPAMVQELKLPTRPVVRRVLVSGGKEESAAVNEKYELALAALGEWRGFRAELEATLQEHMILMAEVERLDEGEAWTEVAPDVESASEQMIALLENMAAQVALAEEASTQVE